MYQGPWLAIVKYVLLRHHATLTVKPEAGKGSGVIVVFPKPWASTLSMDCRLRGNDGS